MTSKILPKVFGWMFIGLLVTFFTGYYVSLHPETMFKLFGSYAFLIVIIIISLGVYVVSMGRDQIAGGEQALSDLEINTFNSTYENYEGTSVAGSRVNSLVKSVYNHNLTESDETRKISIDGDVSLIAVHNKSIVILLCSFRAVLEASLTINWMSAET